MPEGEGIPQMDLSSSTNDFSGMEDKLSQMTQVLQQIAADLSQLRTTIDRNLD